MDPLDFSYFENAANARAQQHQQRVNINLRFFVKEVENKAKSLEAGRPIYDLIDMCELNVPGSRDTVDKKCSNPDFQAKYGEQYKMWKQTQEQPVDGTPLTMVPFLNIAQIKEMAVLNVMTLEQLANLSDTAVQKLGMGYVELRRKAHVYMKDAADSAATQKTVAENEALKAELVRQAQQIAALTQRIETLMSGGGGPALHPSVVLNGQPAAFGAPPPPPAPAEPVFDVAAFIREEVRKATAK